MAHKNIDVSNNLDQYLKSKFKLLTQKFGIVYTPIELVDFIIKSVEDILQKDFNKSLADPDVKIIDPFSGTAKFTARLLTNGVIPKNKLEYKYKNDIYVQEIIQLAHAIGLANIELAYHEIMGKEAPYTPFPNAKLCDTFQEYEDEQQALRDKGLLSPLKTKQKNEKELKTIQQTKSNNSTSFDPQLLLDGQQSSTDQYSWA